MGKQALSSVVRQRFGCSLMLCSSWALWWRTRKASSGLNLASVPATRLKVEGPAGRCERFLLLFQRESTITVSQEFNGVKAL